jgi:hypothetical protein
MTTDELRAAIFESLRHIAPEADPAALDPDVDLLNKPYTQQDLALKIRELLDRA